MPDRQNLAESRPTLLAEAVGETGRYQVQLIDSGWGSSGYYSPEVLQEAAGRRVFGEGLHMYADHPRGDGSGVDGHGNRSVHDLWAVLASDATVDPATGALVAEAQVFAPYRQLVSEMASSIGLSIRAVGMMEEGEADGRRGNIITSLDEAMSVDFVVAAGRGGRILQVVESARAHATAVAEALPGSMTADGLRAALHDVVRSRYGASSDRYAYVEDFTDSTVYYRAGGENVPTRLWQQNYEVAGDSNTPTLLGQPTEVRAETRYVPVSPAGSTTTESQGGTMPQIEEARLRQLEEAAGRVSVLEAELATANGQRDTAVRALAESRARNTAQTRARANLAEANLPGVVVDRIVNQCTVTVPLTESGQLDETALDTAVTAARTAEEAYIASIAEAAGAGQPRFLGGGTTTSVVTEAALDQLQASVFGRQTVKEA